MAVREWVIAGGGLEPVFPAHGLRWQYMWNRKTGRHAYYCFEHDTFYTTFRPEREVIE